MTKKEMIKKLEEVYGELEVYPGDTSLTSAVRDIEQIKDRLGEIITEIEDDDKIVGEKEEEEEDES